jgi:hypothetical protein
MPKGNYKHGFYTKDSKDKRRHLGAQVYRATALDFKEVCRLEGLTQRQMLESMIRDRVHRNRQAYVKELETRLVDLIAKEREITDKLEDLTCEG